MTDARKRASEKTAEEYARKKGKGKQPPAAILGFIKRNGLGGKSIEEIDALLVHATKLRGELLGEGDKFRRWCEQRGRELPSDAIIEEMNRDPFEAGQSVRRDIPNHPKVWKSWCTYQAGAGRLHV